jgi:hypothetical protein
MIPPTHFNATIMLKSLKNRPKGVKISQFCDNSTISAQLPFLLPIETKEGCAGYTALPIELYDQYQDWLKQVGSGKGRHKQVDTLTEPQV